MSRNSDKLVAIDDVRRDLNLFLILLSIIDKSNEAGQLILLGSASHSILSQSSENLAGNIVYRDLTPITFEEATLLKLETLWFGGGYPRAMLAPTDFFFGKNDHLPS